MANDEDTAKPEPGYDPTGLVHAYVLDGRGGATTLRTWDAIDAWKPSDGVLWLNLDYSMARAAAWLASATAGIAGTVREALVDTDPRPRAVVVGEQDLQVIVRGINVNAGQALEDMISIRGWFQAERVITLRRRRSRSVKSIADDLERGNGPRDAGEVLATLVDRIVEHVGTHVDTLGDEIAATEDAVLGATSGRRGGDLRGQLADQRRRAIALRRFLGPQREALAKLAMVTQLRWLGADAHARLAQNADRMTRTVEELDAARDRAAVTQEELQSRLAELTNQRLYVLSVITAVFLPLGFVCSLLGVNVGGVPLRDDEWAFWALCGTFVVGVAAQFWIFKRRGWFGR